MPEGDPDRGDRAGTLTRQAMGGLRWTYIATALTLVMQLGYSAAMARLLDPAVFGLLASSQVVLRFGQYLAEMGLGPALVQRDDLREDDVRAAFGSSTLLGALLCAVVAAGAPAAALLFGDPELTGVIRAMSLSLLLAGTALTAHNLLRRALRFKVIALIDITSYAVGYLGVGLTLAVLGAGVWSLVAAVLVQVAIDAAGNLLAARHPMRPRLRGGRLRSLYAFGGRVSAISMLEYVGQALVVVIIGRNAGQAPLGQYNRASLLIDLPLVNLSLGLSSVLFPALSRIQHDRERVRRAYLGAVAVASAVLVPLGAGVAVAADEIVGVVLGPGWEQAARILPLLAGAAVLAALSHFGGIVAESLGLLNAKLVVQSSYVALLIGGLLLVPRGSLVAYASVLFASQGIRHVAYVVFMRRSLRISWRPQAATYARSAVAGGIVAAAIWSTTAVASHIGAPLAATFAAQLITGAAALAVIATHGPLRPVRRDLRQRLETAYGTQGGPRLVLRLLSVGDRTVPSPTSDPGPGPR